MKTTDTIFDTIRRRLETFDMPVPRDEVFEEIVAAAHHAGYTRGLAAGLEQNYQDSVDISGPSDYELGYDDALEDVAALATQTSDAGPSGA